jgi:hypothetical protein
MHTGKVIDAYHAAVAAARPGTHVELEMRFKRRNVSDTPLYVRLVGILLGWSGKAPPQEPQPGKAPPQEPQPGKGAPAQQQPYVEYAIAFITNQADGNIVHTLPYVGGIKQPEASTFVLKTRTVKPASVVGVIPYDLAVATEEQLPRPASAPQPSLTRVKVRLCVPLTIEGSEWRADITLTKTSRDMQLVPAAKRALIDTSTTSGLTAENFADLAPWGLADELEFEMEYVGGAPPAPTDVAALIWNAVDPQHAAAAEYAHHIMHVAKVIYHNDRKILSEFRANNKGIRNLYNRVFNLTTDSWNRDVRPHIENYYALLKADGVRTLLILNGADMIALGDTATIHKLPRAVNAPAVADAECVDGIYHVFDVLEINGENITQAPTHERVSHIQQFVTMAGALTREKHMVRLSAATYTTQLAALYSDDHKGDHPDGHAVLDAPYPVDGVIFTQAMAPYSKMKSYKWKPPQHLTIDFLVKSKMIFCGTSVDVARKHGIVPLANMSSIFPGYKQHRLYPIQFAPPDEPGAYKWPDAPAESADKVCEVRRVANAWVLVRVRDDRANDLANGRYFGNNYLTAIQIWNMIKDPLSWAAIIAARDDAPSYFREEKQDQYRASTAYNSYVKTRLIKPLATSKLIIDLMAGQGADLFRLSDHKVKSAIFVDRDADALAELLRRKLDSDRRRKRMTMHVSTVRADMTAPADDVLRQIGAKSKADGAMCNFGIHYVLATPEMLRNFIAIVAGLLATGGTFFFTAFDGELVHAALAASGAAREWKTEAPRYSIIRKYQSDTLEATGQPIDVLLPFSDGNYYEEYLVNFDYVIDEFTRNGFALKARNNFLHLAPEYQSTLGDVDRSWVGLYAYAVLVKTI